MPTPDDEAELERTKMSFGQHLEELRAALFKSLLAIVLGFLAGLLVGRQLVFYIQEPLREALEDFYISQAVERQIERLEQMKSNGETVPDDIEAAAKAFARERLVPSELLVDSRDILDAWTQRFPDAEEQLHFPPGVAERPAGELPKRSELLQLRVYTPLEEDARTQVVALGAQEPFLIFVKASLVVGLIISSPFVFFFIWDFVASGLYKHERKYIYVFLPMSLGLFLAGAALAFYVAIDFVLAFLLQFFGWMGIQPSLRISEWMSFVLMLPLGFGISFQLPLVMLFLERVGIFTIETYVSKWRVAILVIAVVSMFLTPADPGSMIVMATPLTALYFLGIAMCKLFPSSFSSDDESRGDLAKGSDATGS